MDKKQTKQGAEARARRLSTEKPSLGQGGQPIVAPRTDSGRLRADYQANREGTPLGSGSLRVKPEKLWNVFDMATMLAIRSSPMGRKRLKLSDQVRRAMDESGLTRYAISKVTGIDGAALCRFASGERGVSMANLDILADLLRLNIVATGKPGRKPRKAR